MADAVVLLERFPPDRTATAGLPATLAAEIDLLAGRTEPWVEAPAPGLRARALVLAGRGAEARAALADLDVEGCSLAEVAAAGWAVSRVGPAALVPALRARVTGAEDILVDQGIPLGPRDTLLGLLDVAGGRLERAVGLLRAGVRHGDGRAPVWGAVARLELARVLVDLALDQPGADPVADQGTEAGAVLASAQIFFAAGGYRALGERLALLAVPSTAVLDGLVARPAAGVLARDGGGAWRVGFGVQPPLEVPEAKGLRALAHLVDRRGESVPAVSLDALLDGRPAGAAPVPPGASRDELRAALFDDRARTRVSKLVRRTVDRLIEVHPRLGAHLRASIATGHACSYGAHAEVRWLR